MRSAMVFARRSTIAISPSTDHITSKALDQPILHFVTKPYRLPSP